MSITLSDFTKIEKIGSGSFGEVWKVRRKKDNKVFVWKEVHYADMEKKKRELLVHEILLLQNLNHPNIVQYVGNIDDSSNGIVYILMEFCPDGDLNKFIIDHRRSSHMIPEDKIWLILTQLVYALAYCHGYQETVTESDGSTKVVRLTVLHRDVKPGNVFMTDRNRCMIKLGDFGLAKILMPNAPDYTKTVLGSPFYMPPELWNGQPYNEKCDVWSLGCLVHELCMLNPPFSGDTPQALAANICSRRRTPIPEKFYSRDLERIIAWMISIDANQRPSMDDLKKVPKINDFAIALHLAPVPATTACLPQPTVLHRSSSEAALSQRFSELKVRERELHDKEELIKTEEDKMNRIAAELKNRETLIIERESSIAKRETSLQEKEREIVARESKVAEGERCLTSVYEKNQKELESYHVSLVKKEEELMQWEVELKKRAEELDRLLVDVNGKLATLQTEQKELSQKEAQLRSKQHEFDVLLNAQEQINTLLSPIVHKSSTNLTQTPSRDFNFTFQTPWTAVHTTSQQQQQYESPVPAAADSYDDEAPMQSPEKRVDRDVQYCPIRPTDDEESRDPRLDPNQKPKPFSCLLGNDL